MEKDKKQGRQEQYKKRAVSMIEGRKREEDRELIRKHITKNKIEKASYKMVKEQKGTKENVKKGSRQRKYGTKDGDKRIEKTKLQTERTKEKLTGKRDREGRKDISQEEEQ